MTYDEIARKYPVGSTFHYQYGYIKKASWRNVQDIYDLVDDFLRFNPNSSKNSELCIFKTNTASIKVNTTESGVVEGWVFDGKEWHIGLRSMEQWETINDDMLVEE